MTSNNTIACNSFDYTRFGINFLNANNNTNFEGNEMNNHYIGSLFTHSAIIGVQNDKGNTWTRANYPSSWGAFHTEFAKLNPNFLVAILNRIETSSVQLYTPSNNGNNVGGFGINWFNSSLQTPFACSIDFNCTAPPSMLVDTTNHDEIFDKKIAEEYIDSIPYDEQSNWLLDYLLYSNLKKNKEYKNNNPILQFFYDSLQTENIGIINNVHELVELAFTPDSATAAQERIHIQALDALLDSLALTDSLLYHANAADSLLLLNEKTSLINQIDSVNAHLQSLAEIINLHKQNYLNMALLENENIQEGLLFENNEKVVNELYINAVRENDFDFTAEKQLIIDLISYLCPFAGGPAVYRASELQAWYNYVQYDDDSICIASGINPRLMNEENNVQNVQVQVYPNPANNLLNIVFDAEPGSEYTFVLYDLLGKEIMHKSLIGSLTEIKLNEVKAGVYNYQILNNKKPIQTDKLIIIH